MRDKDGREKARGVIKNAATTAGRNYMLDTAFRGTTQDSSWHLGLIINAATVTLAAADTMSSHTGWTETHTTYDEATRPACTFAAASGALISNTASVATFTFNTSVTLYGCFLTSDGTKGGTSGSLWATGAFDSTLSVVNADVLELTYECELLAVA